MKINFYANNQTHIKYTTPTFKAKPITIDWNSESAKKIEMILAWMGTMAMAGITAYKKNKDRSKWMFLPAEMGIYFSFFEEKPFFLDLIPLLVDLEDYKDIDKERNRKALKKIITSTVPIDNEGHLVFEPDEALEMHKGIC